MNESKEEGEELLEIFGQVADVSLELATALDQHGCDVTPAAAEVLAVWTEARPETRSAALLGAAWGSREQELGAEDVHATELHGFAREHSGDEDGFRLAWGDHDDPDLRAFLREVKGDADFPLHAQAGALAARLSSEEPASSLKTALTLLAPIRRAAPAE
jgi:hypothetical protein